MTENTNLNYYTGDDYTHYTGEDKVILISKDKDSFTVKKEISLVSVLIKTMIDDDDDDDDVDMDADSKSETDITVPLLNVNSKVLIKVINFCTYHYENGPMKEIEKPLTDTNLKNIVSEWDGTFIQSFEQEELFEIILAANYMDIKPLLDLGCAQIATQIKGKTPEEIRQTFNIENDFTPEEEAQIREENKWCID